MPFDFSVSVPAFTVFLQGILSFFSPCVLPLVPLYVSYLAGGTRTVDEEGTVRYKRRTIFLNTLFFVLGISFTFFLLGLDSRPWAAFSAATSACSPSSAV